MLQNPGLNAYDKLRETVTSIKNLDLIATQALAKEIEFDSVPTQNSYSDCKNMYKQVNESLTTTINKLMETIDAVDVLLNQKKDQLEIKDDSIPTQPEIEGLLMKLFRGKPKEAGSPIPQYCGRFAYKIPEFKQNHFLCARISQQFVLVIVFKQVKDTVTVYDPYDTYPPKLMDLNKSEVTPLPTIIPFRPMPRWEFTIGNNVLFILPEPHSKYFHSARVIKRPSDNKDSRDYWLEVDGSGEQISVPEQFVVEYHKRWRKPSA